MDPSSNRTLHLWRRLVEGLAGGKLVHEERYVHRSAVPTVLDDAIESLRALAGCAHDDVDVVKVNLRVPRVSLLHYPGFFTEGFPTLRASWRIDLATGDVEGRSFRDDANPPLLHRKEQMLADDHPQREVFERLTAEAESHGLFRDAAIIGHRDQWLEELRARGLVVVDHSLVAGTAPEPIFRHRTAMARRALSTPMQALWRHGFLTPTRTVLDYGCGRGDDLAALTALGLDASGWDPYFRPEGERRDADVVNLGFVLNVIEDPRERADALRQAYGHTRTVLAVSALIGGRTAFERYRLFRDGVLTSRGTFQKYFTHVELGAYVTEVLGREPVSVGPGLYFVFRDDDAEQDFLERRQRSGALADHPAPPPAVPSSPRPVPAPRAPRSAPRERPAKPERPARPAPVDPTTTPAWTALWASICALGRVPRPDDFADASAQLDAVGSVARALPKLLARHGESTLAAARTRRMNDLRVFFALQQFERRASTAMSARLRNDVREFWSSLPRAHDEARTLLFSLRDNAVLEAACAEAAMGNLGHLMAGESLQLDARLVNELPPALRVFLGCAGRLLGEAQDADVVKIHLGSGKATLLRYDDYEGAAIPHLIERVKVDLRRQQVHDFQYGDVHAPQPLYLKSRYMHPRQEGWDAQRTFDDALRALPAWNDEGFGPPLEAFGSALDTLPLPPGTTLTTDANRPGSRRPPP